MRKAGWAAVTTAVAILFAGPSARAEDYTSTTMTAPELLAKARTAAGALEPGRYSVIEIIHGTSVDTTLGTRIDGDDFMTTEQSGQFRSAYGRYRNQTWAQDENGIVRYTVRRSKFADALEHSGDSQRVRVLGLTTSQPQAYVLDIRPDSTEEQLRYYDAKTFLLSRVVTKHPNGVEAKTQYDDYRRAFGEMRSYRWEYRDGLRENDSTGSVALMERDASDAVSLAPPPSYALFSLPKGQTVTLPARFDHTGITVAVTVGHETLDFLLDTGAESLAIDPGAVHRLGLSSYGREKERIGGDYDSSRAMVPDVSVGPLRMHNLEFDVVPLDDRDHHVGLLGCDFLASAVVGIDMKDQKVTLTPSGSFDPKALGLMALPATMDDCVPEVSGSFDGIPGTFLMDTGSDVTILQRSYAQKIASARSAGDGDYQLNYIGGGVGAKIYNIPDLIFGPIRFKSAHALVMSGHTADFSYTDGIIGRDVLQSYVIYLDYGSGIIYLKPNM